MSKVKNWMMDMEDEIVFAIESGAKTTDDVVAFVKTNITFIVCGHSFKSIKTMKNRFLI